MAGNSATDAAQSALCRRTDDSLFTYKTQYTVPQTGIESRAPFIYAFAHVFLIFFLSPLYLYHIVFCSLMYFPFFLFYFKPRRIFNFLFLLFLHSSFHHSSSLYSPRSTNYFISILPSSAPNPNSSFVLSPFIQISISI